MAVDEKNSTSAIDRIKEIIAGEQANTQVLCVYGENDESRKQLGKEVKTKISTDKKHVIDFDIPSYEGVAEHLARLSVLIRNGQKCEQMFPRFDYAYVKYMESRGYDVKRTPKRKRVTESPLYNITIQITKWLFAASPVSEILELIKEGVALYDEVQEISKNKKYHDIRKEIDDLTPQALITRLPEYFAGDLNDRQEIGKSLVLYLDSYCEQMQQNREDWLFGESGVICHVKGTKWIVMCSEKPEHIYYQDGGTCFTDIPLDELREKKREVCSFTELLLQINNTQKEMLYALVCLGMWNEYVIREIIVCEDRHVFQDYEFLRDKSEYLISTEGAVSRFRLTEDMMPEQYPYEKKLRLLRKMEALLSGIDSECFTEKEKLLYFSICFHIMEGMGDELNEPLLEWQNKAFMDIVKYLLHENAGEELRRFCEQAERTYRNGHYGITLQLLILRYCAQALCDEDTSDMEKEITELTHRYSLRGELDYPLEAAYAAVMHMEERFMYREMNFIAEAVGSIMQRRQLYYRYQAVSAKIQSYIRYKQMENDLHKSGISFESKKDEAFIRSMVDIRHSVRELTSERLEKEMDSLYEAFQSDKEDPLYQDALHMMIYFYRRAYLNIDKEHAEDCLQKYLRQLAEVDSDSARIAYLGKAAFEFSDEAAKRAEVKELFGLLAVLMEKYQGKLKQHDSEIYDIVHIILVNVTWWAGLCDGAKQGSGDQKIFERVFLELYEYLKKTEPFDFELFEKLVDMAQINYYYFIYVPQALLDDIDAMTEELQKLDKDQIIRALAAFGMGWGKAGLTDEYLLVPLPEERLKALCREKYRLRQRQCFNRMYQILQEMYEEEMQKYVQERLPEELADRYRRFLLALFSCLVPCEKELRYEILSMLGVDCEAERRAAQHSTATAQAKQPKGDLLYWILNYSFTAQDNKTAETQKLVDGVIKGWRRLREDYGEEYVREIWRQAGNYERYMEHEFLAVLPEKLKSEILLQKSRK